MFGQQDKSVEERGRDLGREVQEKGREVGREGQEYAHKAEEQFDKTKQEIRSQARTALPKPGQPRIGVFIAGFPSPLAKELADVCCGQGLIVSDVALGCSSKRQKVALYDGTQIDVLDCEDPATEARLNEACDALEKEGAEAIIVLDVTQDYKSIDLYNRLKIPFVHAGSPDLQEERKMYELTANARNAAVIAPYISRESALIQLMFESFARQHAGLFRDWSLDLSDHMSEHNAVAAAKRRTQAALSFLLDRDVKEFASLTSGKGTLTPSDESSHQQQEKPKEGMLQKLGLASAATAVKDTAQELFNSGVACRASFTLRSPDGKHSFTMGHAHYGLADTHSVVEMAEFLADKIAQKREARVWGIKDWVSGMDDVNRRIAEECGCAGTQGQQQQKQGTAVRGRRWNKPAGLQHQQEFRAKENVTGSAPGEYQKEEHNRPTLTERMGVATEPLMGQTQ